MTELKELSARIGKRVVLKDISASVQEGSITVLLGKNGSGKTTLLKTMAGLLPYGGSILVDGRELSGMTRREQGNALAYLPQKTKAPAISVRQLVELGLDGRVPQDRMQKAVETALERMEILPLAERLLCHISGGERQLAYLAMTLARRAKVLLLDEPFASLDPERVHLLLTALKDMKHDGVTIFLSMHEIQDAMTLADQILLLDQGRTLWNGTPETLIQSGCIEKVFHLVPIDTFDEAGNRYQVFKRMD